MHVGRLLEPDLRRLLEESPEDLREAIEELHPEDLAELTASLPPAEAARLLEVLDPETAAELLERLPPEAQRGVLQALPAERAASLLGEMSPDDRVDLIQELEPEQAQAVMAALEAADKEAAEEVRELGAWGPETAGGLMTPDFVALPPETTVREALDALRHAAREGEVETIYYIYVVGYGRKLLGVLSLRDIILADPDAQLADVMNPNVVHVAPTDDQEQVAEVMARYDLAALPVVDERGRMLGVVTVDDVIDVVIEEATEDAQKMGAVVPLEDSYFATPPLEFVWKRAVWLIVLFAGQLLTANVMSGNLEELRRYLELAIFVPLVVAAGGNAGSQSSSLIIRALAVGEVRLGDWFRVARRELGIGVALGTVLGLVAFGRAWFESATIPPLLFGGIVGVSVLSNITMAALVGSQMPLLIRRMGLDPAVSSGPFIASLIDVLGLTVYFGVARVLLHLAV